MVSMRAFTKTFTKTCFLYRLAHIFLQRQPPQGNGAASHFAAEPRTAVPASAAVPAAAPAPAVPSTSDWGVLAATQDVPVPSAPPQPAPDARLAEALTGSSAQVLLRNNFYEELTRLARDEAGSNTLNYLSIA